MKRIIYLILILSLAGAVLTSCGKTRGDNDNIVPKKFKVGISDAISSPDLAKKSLLLDINTDTVKGDELYKHLRNLVYVGEFSADVINASIQTIRDLNINKPMQFSFISSQDGRVKDVVVEENVTFLNNTWAYGMYITDSDKPAFQLFWNPDPIKGVAIMKVGTFNFNAPEHKNAMLMLEYSEAEPEYDCQMIVSITNLDSTSRNSMNKMKMFVGQKGDTVQIRGNSNHPTAQIMNSAWQGGRSWCFVAKNNVALDIAVAKVALPPVSHSNTLDLWTDYSMEKVLEDEVKAAYNILPVADQNVIIGLVTANAKIPGFFQGDGGFISSGLANIPSNTGFTPKFINLGYLQPYTPSEVNMLVISFKAK